MKSVVNLSIIIPCYNEGAKLIDNIDKINQYMSEEFFDYKYEILIVNDGSKDNTLNICKQIENKYDFVHIISYLENKGKGYAVKKGIEHSKGKYVIFMDADLSTKLTAIKECLTNLNTYSTVIGSRRHTESILTKKQNKLRQFIGKSCSILTNIIIPLHLKDTQCGFKGFNGDLIRNVVKKQTLNGFSFDVELLYIISLSQCQIKEIPVEWENDTDSKVSVVNSSINFFIDLFKIRLNKKYYKE